MSKIAIQGKTFNFKEFDVKVDSMHKVVKMKAWLNRGQHICDVKTSEMTDKLSLIWPLESNPKQHFWDDEIKLKCFSDLKKVANPSLVGKNNDTVLDPKVRKASEIKARDIDIDPEFLQFLTTQVNDKMQKEMLHVPEKLSLVFHKMVIYEKKDFFQRHIDNIHTPNQIMTLSVDLSENKFHHEVKFGEEPKVKIIPKIPKMVEQFAKMPMVLFFHDVEHRVDAYDNLRISLIFDVVTNEAISITGYDDEERVSMMNVGAQKLLAAGVKRVGVYIHHIYFGSHDADSLKGLDKLYYNTLIKYFPKMTFEQIIDNYPKTIFSTLFETYDNPLYHECDSDNQSPIIKRQKNESFEKKKSESKDDKTNDEENSDRDETNTDEEKSGRSKDETNTDEEKSDKDIMQEKDEDKNVNEYDKYEDWKISFEDHIFDEAYCFGDVCFINTEKKTTKLFFPDDEVHLGNEGFCGSPIYGTYFMLFELEKQ
jgi:hypothetical protein